MNVDGGAAFDTGRCLRIELDIWHPDCWTLLATAATDAGLLGHGVYTIDDTAVGRFTAFADTSGEIDKLVRESRKSPLTRTIQELPGRLATTHRSGETAGLPPGNATRGLLVTYDPAFSISGPLLSQGFVPDAPVRIRNGREHWTLLSGAERDAIPDRLSIVREAADAEVELKRITAPEGTSATLLPEDALSERQRDAFELARARGYYEWPRAISCAELAEEFGVSKATFLEHLRKAEAKLLDP